MAGNYYVYFVLFHFPLSNHANLMCNPGVAATRTKLGKEIQAAGDCQLWLAGGTLQGGVSPNTRKGAQLATAALPPRRYSMRNCLITIPAVGKGPLGSPTRYCSGPTRLPVRCGRHGQSRKRHGRPHHRHYTW